MVKRLLILSCSARKTDDTLCEAVKRYQSPAFYVVRRFLKNNPDTETVIWILSGKYGLIAADYDTAHYDTAMTAEHAEKLKPWIAEQFKFLEKRFFADGLPKYVFCHLPATYQTALEKQIGQLRHNSKVDIAKGAPGKKLQQLKHWLEKENR